MKFDRKENTLFLDMDGVLADFDKFAIKLFGMKPEKFDEKYGQEKFWNIIKEHGEFFLRLETMPDMKVLYNYCKKYDPTILTGIPLILEEQYGKQKIEWSRRKFGDDQKIILTRASKKHIFCKPGDIIIDDRVKYKHLWEKAGGTYIVHTSAEDSINQLKKMGL